MAPRGLLLPQDRVTGPRRTPGPGCARGRNDARGPGARGAGAPAARPGPRIPLRGAGALRGLQARGRLPARGDRLPPGWRTARRPVAGGAQRARRAPAREPEGRTRRAHPRLARHVHQRLLEPVQRDQRLPLEDHRVRRLPDPARPARRGEGVPGRRPQRAGSAPQAQAHPRRHRGDDPAAEGRAHRRHRAPAREAGPGGRRRPGEGRPAHASAGRGREAHDDRRLRDAARGAHARGPQPPAPPGDVQEAHQGHRLRARQGRAPEAHARRGQEGPQAAGRAAVRGRVHGGPHRRRVPRADAPGGAGRGRRGVAGLRAGARAQGRQGRHGEGGPHRAARAPELRREEARAHQGRARGPGPAGGPARAQPEGPPAHRGHTDSKEVPEPARQSLSDARARAVADLLIRAGVAPSRVEAVGLGDSSPKAPNLIPRGRELNRRVELTLLRPDTDSRGLRLLEGSSSVPGVLRQRAARCLATSSPKAAPASSGRSPWRAPR
ncbi:OmpA family protein [Corallococcus sp. 4LFB]|uniref:OmpA family protein n=1 Tax=Corallococcus sp. 4LFB TaxID=3383249 RepID=UPI003974AFF3